MSALGHKQTSWLAVLDVSFGPEADIQRLATNVSFRLWYIRRML